MQGNTGRTGRERPRAKNPVLVGEPCSGSPSSVAEHRADGCTTPSVHRCAEYRAGEGSRESASNRFWKADVDDAFANACRALAHCPGLRQRCRAGPAVAISASISPRGKACAASHPRAETRDVEYCDTFGRVGDLHAKRIAARYARPAGPPPSAARGPAVCSKSGLNLERRGPERAAARRHGVPAISPACPAPTSRARCIRVHVPSGRILSAWMKR